MAGTWVLRHAAAWAYEFKDTTTHERMRGGEVGSFTVDLGTGGET
jgi:hypothetical protein